MVDMLILKHGWNAIAVTRTRPEHAGDAGLLMHDWHRATTTVASTYSLVVAVMVIGPKKNN